MCTRDFKYARKDLRQLKALFMRFFYFFKVKTFKRICEVLYTTIVVFFCFLISAYVIYQPHDLQMKSTEQYHVTSTEDQLQFLDASSGFQSEFALHNCTLRQRFTIGLVRQDDHGNEDGYPVLEAVFDELAARYHADAKGDFRMTKMTFETQEDLDHHVNKFAYAQDGLCFALAWEEFDLANSRFYFDVRLNFGDILSPRLGQTEYEESLQNQLYLGQYANSGMLQTMTTVTSKLLTQVYNMPEDSFKFELMYMPMDSGIFRNDMYAEVVNSLMVFTLMTIANIAQRVLTSMADPDESRIKAMLQRLGMRRNVEAMFEFVISLVLIPVFLIPIVAIAHTQVMPTTSFGFILIQVLIFTFRNMTQGWMIHFFIDNHHIAEVVETAFEVVQIALVVYSNVLRKLDPTYILVASFLLPLMYMSQIGRLGIIAFNKNIYVQLGQPNVIVNHNDMTQIMHYSLLALALSVLFLLYMIPLKILNDPKKLWGPLYPFHVQWWRDFCCPRPADEDQEGADDSYKRVEEATELQQLHEDEKKMIEQGKYEAIQLHDCVDFLKLSRVNVEHGGHHLVHDLSLTVKKGETFVLIGENGSGKSAILQTIAGLQHVHSGTATAFGFDLFRSFRFMSDNFVAFSSQDPIVVDSMTAEQHLNLLCTFLGVEDMQATVERNLQAYNLYKVRKIKARSLTWQDRKMLAFAISMLGDTRLLLLDEPTQGMNSYQKQIIWEIIQRRRKDRIILIATQDMKEARALGDRIGLVSHGSLKLCGSPKFFARRFKHSIQLALAWLPGRDQTNEKTQQLRDLIQRAVRPGVLDYEIIEDRRERQLVVKLPPGTQYQTLGECIDVSMLQLQQGKLFEQLRIKSASLAETFSAMLKEVHESDEHHGDEHHKHSISGGGSEAASESGTSFQTFHLDEPEKICNNTTKDSLKALLKAEFMTKFAVHQMAAVLGCCLIALLQETFSIYFLTNFHQPTINYNNVEETFEENGPPILILANTETARGQSTSQFFSSYKDVVNENGESESVMLHTLDLATETSLSVKDTLTEAGALFFETAEEFVEEEDKEAFAAFYIYDFDSNANSYSIGIYGNQLAAASCPTFGATMLKTLAQDVTGDRTLDLQFHNKLLAENNALVAYNKLGVAETYGVSILAVATVLAMFQVRSFGEPIHKGFYSSFIASGGSRLAYVASKYSKAVFLNFIAMSFVLIEINSQKFDCAGLPVFLLIWTFANPVYVFASTAIVTRKYNLSPVYAEKYAYRFSGLLAILALIMAGSLVYAHNGLEGIKGFFYVFYFHPTFLLFVASQLGFTFQTIQIKDHQQDSEIILNPWEYPAFILIVIYMTAGIFLWAFVLRRLLNRKSIIGRYCCCLRAKPLPPIHDGENNCLQDSGVVAEAELINQLVKDKQEHILVVQNLQTFSTLLSEDVDGKAPDGHYLDQVYFHDHGVQGFYETKGVSFALGQDQRMVILSDRKSGAQDLFITLVGEKCPIYGEFWINKLPSSAILKDHRNLHGIVSFQPLTDSVDDDLTVKQHLTIFATIAGIPEQDHEIQVAEMIKACVLSGKEDTVAGDLSPGLLRRLTLGMALIGRAKLTILSDSLEGVDPSAKQTLIQTILQYTDGRALLMSSQDSEVAQRIGNRVGILQEGRLISIGSVKEIIATHGQFYSVEVQADLKKLAAQRPDSVIGDSEFIESHDQAREFLERIQAKLQESKVDVSCEDLVREYKADGELSAVYKEFAESISSMDRSSFLNEVLILNMALRIKASIGALDSGIEVKIISIEGDLIHLELLSVPGSFDVAKFSAELHEGTHELAIAYFSIGAALLEGVQKRLIKENHSKAIGSRNLDMTNLLARQRTVFAPQLSDKLDNAINDDNDEDEFQRSV